MAKKTDLKQYHITYETVETHSVQVVAHSEEEAMEIAESGCYDTDDLKDSGDFDDEIESGCTIETDDWVGDEYDQNYTVQDVTDL